MSDTRAAETHSALKNGLKLAGSLLASWGIALGVRVWAPRHLGPARFGELNFSDSFAGTFFVIATLGVDMWIRKEVGVREKGANALFGGVLALRLAMAVILTSAMVLTLRMLGRSVEIQQTVCVFAVAQLLVLTNNTLSALLHNTGKVDGLSVTNIVGKLVWGGLLIGAIVASLPLQYYAAALAVSEAGKMVAIWALARRHAALELHLDWPAVGKMMRYSLPYFVNGVAVVAIGKLDSAILGTLTNDAEVGWYGSVNGLMGIAMVITPVAAWVLLPLMSKAALRSTEELNQIISRAVEGVLVLGIPVALLVGLGAELWIPLLYGSAFAPAIVTLKVLAPAFALNYLNVVCSMSLAAQNRGWSLALSSILTLVLSPTINLLTIVPIFTWLGPSGGATACAASVVAVELIVTLGMMVRMGRTAFDRRTVSMLSRTALVAVACLALDFGLVRLGLWVGLRLLIDVPAYVLGVLALGAVRPHEVRDFIRTAREQRARQRAGTA